MGSWRSLVLLAAVSLTAMADTLPQRAPRVPEPDALLDWAERQFPALFPTHQANRTLGAIVYRYYAATGNYVGVNGESVLFLGPPTGNALVSVGTRAQFACQVSPMECAETSTAFAIFQKPFEGEWPTTNFVDHNVPKEFVDTNGVFLTFWGESHARTGGMIDGHSGYDFAMPEGTRILAAAAGRVAFAGVDTPAFCPPLGTSIGGQSVGIDHTLVDGTVVRSTYSHLSRIDVAVGATLAAGQQLGLSGNTGCSTGPHMHFETKRRVGTRFVTIDPYGWSGAGADPWSLASDGATSIQLWREGAAPKLWREGGFDALSRTPPIASVVITRVAYEGVDDAANPNNEYVELALEPRLASAVPLAGYRLSFQASGVTWALPATAVVSALQSRIRIYVGSGADTPDTFYIGRPAGIIANDRVDCIRLLSPGGGIFFLAMSTNSCG